MLHGISWWQFIGAYLAIYVIIIAIVLFKKIPQLLKSKSAGSGDAAPAPRQATTSPVQESPLEKARQTPIWQAPVPPEPVQAMSENEMYDMASLALDELDEVFTACGSEEWSKEELLKNLHRKLQAYLKLVNTKMYTNISSYIENQSLAVCNLELTLAEVNNLW